MRFGALVALPVLASIAACSIAPQTRRAQAVYDARERANRSFMVEDGIALVKAIQTAYDQGDYTANYAQLSSDVLAAQYALDRAVVDDDAEKAKVAAWRGVTYELTGRLTEAREQYTLSFEEAPSYLAGVKLVAVYTSLQNVDSVNTTCKSTYATLTEVDEQMTLIEACSTSLMRLGPEKDALVWLDPQAAAWYKRERARRVKAALAEQEVRRKQKERADRVAAYVQRCSTPCHDSGISCQNKCVPGDVTCNDRCEKTYNTCIDQCEAAATKTFKTAPKPTPKTLGEAQRSAPSARAGAKA